MSLESKGHLDKVQGQPWTNAQRLTAHYQALQEQLHQDPARTYGETSGFWGEVVVELCQGLGTKDVLDYGCGKGRLAEHMPFAIQEYDPAIPKFAAEPYPADVVVCTDVLEHIEPECLDAVLEHLFRLTRKKLFLAFDTGPAGKKLADGRNSHLLQKPLEWWVPKLEHRFVWERLSYDGHAVVGLARPKPALVEAKP